MDPLWAKYQSLQELPSSWQFGRPISTGNCGETMSWSSSPNVGCPLCHRLWRTHGSRVYILTCEFLFKSIFLLQLILSLARMTFNGGGRACMYVSLVVILTSHALIFLVSGFKFSQLEMSEWPCDNRLYLMSYCSSRGRPSDFGIFIQGFSGWKCEGYCMECGRRSLPHCRKGEPSTSLPIENWTHQGLIRIIIDSVYWYGTIQHVLYSSHFMLSFVVLPQLAWRYKFPAKCSCIVVCKIILRESKRPE